MEHTFERTLLLFSLFYAFFLASTSNDCESPKKENISIYLSLIN